MYAFLIPLLVGFAFNLCSAFTTVYSRRWGVHHGRLITAILRNVLGIPVWAVGLGMAACAAGPAFFAPNWAAQFMGWFLILVGGGIILVALYSLRVKAAAPSLQDGLIQNGLYARVRNPIHDGTFLEFAGLFLLFPTIPVSVACGLGMIWVVLQTRFDEYDLIQRIPAYREYMQRVPRFLPRLC